MKSNIFFAILSTLIGLGLATAPSRGETVTFGTLTDSVMVGANSRNPAIAPAAPGDGWFTGAHAGTIRSRKDSKLELRTLWNFRFAIDALSGIAPASISKVTLKIPQIGRHTSLSSSLAALVLRANTYDWSANGSGAGYPVFNGPTTIVALKFGTYNTFGRLQDRTDRNVEGTFVVDSGTYPNLLTVVQGWAANSSRNEGFSLTCPYAEDTGLAFGKPTLVITYGRSPFLDTLFSYTVSKGIIYGQGNLGYPTITGSKTLRLDIYRPTGAGVPTKLPAIVAIHGGGFTSGSSQDNSLVEFCQTYARRGYVVAAINYRLVGDNPSAEPGPLPNTQMFWRAINAAAQDTAKAVRWMRANAGSYGIDPTRIALQGSSSGAITALYAGYQEESAIGKDAQVGAIVDLWGGMNGVESLVDGMDPPVFIVHGTEDTTVPYSEALKLKQQCDGVGVPYKFFPIQGGGHNLWSQYWNDVVDRKTIDRHCAEFLFRHLDLLPLSP
jgi:acetyl esterase/lipase